MPAKTAIKKEKKADAVAKPAKAASKKPVKAEVKAEGEGAAAAAAGDGHVKAELDRRAIKELPHRHTHLKHPCIRRLGQVMDPNIRMSKSVPPYILAHAYGVQLINVISAAKIQAKIKGHQMVDEKDVIEAWRSVAGLNL